MVTQASLLEVAGGKHAPTACLDLARPAQSGDLDLLQEQLEARMPLLPTLNFARQVQQEDCGHSTLFCDRVFLLVNEPQHKM